jgi:transcriptional regulator with XRE-family HTH domain
MPDQPATFGAELRRRRMEASLSLAQLATRVHYSKGYLSQIENGHRQPTSSLARLCDSMLGAGGVLSALVPSRTRTDLPQETAHLVGRRSALDWLDVETPHAQVVIIEGAAGIGKTMLATHWARRSMSNYPDGVVFSNMSRYRTTQEMLFDLLRSLYGSDDLPDGSESQFEICRRLMATRRALVILDDVRDPGLALRLVGNDATSTVLVTTRDWRPDSVPDVRQVHTRLVGLHRDEAIDLIRDRIGAERVDAEPIAADRLADLAGDLPLALELAAAQLDRSESRTIADVVNEMTHPNERSDTPIQLALNEAYERLSPAGATAFRALGVITDVEFPSNLLRFVMAAGRQSVQRATEELARYCQSPGIVETVLCHFGLDLRR